MVLQEGPLEHKMKLCHVQWWILGNMALCVISYNTCLLLVFMEGKSNSTIYLQDNVQSYDALNYRLTTSLASIIARPVPYWIYMKAWSLAVRMLIWPISNLRQHVIPNIGSNPSKWPSVQPISNCLNWTKGMFNMTPACTGFFQQTKLSCKMCHHKKLRHRLCTCMIVTM